MTERRNRDDAALARQMLDAIDHPMAALGADGRLTLANRAFATMLGAVDGGDGLELPAELTAGIADWLRPNGPLTDVEFDVGPPSTGPLRLRARGQRLDAGDGASAILLRLEHAGHREPRRERRDQVEETRDDAWLHQILDAMPHLVWIVDGDGTALYFNKTMRDYIGEPPPAERSSRDQAILHPADVERIQRTRAAGAALGYFALDVRLRRHTGEYRWHNLTVTTIEPGISPRRLVTATDVHELRLATEQLRETEERLILAQNAGRIGIWDYDIAANKATFNGVYCALFGLPPDTEQSYDQFLDMVHEEDRAAVRAANDATMAGQAPYQAEFRIRRPDGAVRWLSSRGDAYKDFEGRPYRFVGVTTDITEAKMVAEDRDRLMAQLSDQLQELEQLYNSAPIGLAMVDSELRFQRINARLAEINGHSVEEHLGRTTWDLLPDLREEAEPIFRRIFETGVGIANVEISGETPAQPGTRRHWVEQFYPVKDASGRVRAVGIICEETTDRRVAEDRLRLSEERLRLATEGADIGVFEWNPETDTSIFINARMHQLLGTQTAVSSEAFFDQFVHPDDVAAIRSLRSLEDRSTGQPVQISCRVRRMGETEWRHMEFVGEFLPMGEHGALHFLGVARDVTARKQAEETQRLLIAELNHRVKNTLATVQAIANQTLRRARTPADFVQGLTGRLHALSRAHNLLTDATWSGADLGRLVREQLVLGDAADQRIDVAGPAITLLPQVALRLGLVIHELGTNARKYGALSTPGGTVRVAWKVANDRRILELDWTEENGPPVEPPSHRGFGTRLIEASMTALGGRATVDYHPNGLRRALQMPLD